MRYIKESNGKQWGEPIMDGDHGEYNCQLHMCEDHEDFLSKLKAKTIPINCQWHELGDQCRPRCNPHFPNPEWSDAVYEILQGNIALNTLKEYAEKLPPIEPSINVTRNCGEGVEL